MGEIFFLLFWIGVSIGMFVLTFSFRESPLDKTGGAALFPRILLVLLLIFLIIRLVTVLRQKEKNKFVFWEMFQGTRLFFLADLLIYIFLLSPLGYLISTSLFMISLILGFQYFSKGSIGKPGQVAVISCASILFVAGMYLFFAKLLSIYLPVGILGI